MRWLKAIFLIIFFGLGVIFIIQNLEFFNQTAQFEFNLYFIHLISIPLKFYILLIFSFLLGSIFGMFYTFKGWLKKRRELKSKDKEIKRLKEELDSLRNLPLKGERMEST